MNAAYGGVLVILAIAFRVKWLLGVRYRLYRYEMGLSIGLSLMLFNDTMSQYEHSA